MLQDRAKSALEKFLSIFTEVRSGEGATAFLLTLNIFLILLAYYIIKPVREGFILAGGGAEIKSYASAGQALLLLLLVPLYAKLAGRMSRRRLINTVTMFFTICLALFYILARTPFPLGVIFYLWVGIFSLMVIAQFWAFANDVYTTEEGKRLFVLLVFGQSAGAVLGTRIPALLRSTLGIYELLVLAGLILGCSLLVFNIVESRERRRVAQRAVHREEEAEAPIGKEGAYRLLFRNRYLLLIAFLLLFLNWVNTTGEYILARLVEEDSIRAFAEGLAGGLSQEAFMKERATYFYADFFFVVNLLGFLAQLFLVSRIIKHLGVRIGLILLPLLAIGGYGLLGIVPLLAVVRWSKVAENATDYSLYNTVRAVLFLPTTREEKYKAKQATDTIFVRTGDVLSAALVYMGVHWWALETAHFAAFNIGLAVVWLGIAVWVGIENKKLLSARGES